MSRMIRSEALTLVAQQRGLLTSAELNRLIASDPSYGQQIRNALPGPPTRDAADRQILTGSTEDLPGSTWDLLLDRDFLEHIFHLCLAEANSTLRTSTFVPNLGSVDVISVDVVTAVVLPGLTSERQVYIGYGSGPDYNYSRVGNSVLGWADRKTHKFLFIELSANLTPRRITAAYNVEQVSYSWTHAPHILRMPYWEKVLPVRVGLIGVDVGEGDVWQGRIYKVRRIGAAPIERLRLQATPVRMTPIDVSGTITRVKEIIARERNLSVVGDQIYILGRDDGRECLTEINEPRRIPPRGIVYMGSIY